jgi:hypothetical protein
MRKLAKRIIIASAFLLGVGVTQAATYYADFNGTDPGFGAATNNIGGNASMDWSGTIWTLDATGVAAPGSWVNGNDAVISAPVLGGNPGGIIVSLADNPVINMLTATNFNGYIDISGDMIITNLVANQNIRSIGGNVGGNITADATGKQWTFHSHGLQSNSVFNAGNLGTVRFNKAMIPDRINTSSFIFNGNTIAMNDDGTYDLANITGNGTFSTVGNGMDIAASWAPGATGSAGIGSFSGSPSGALILQGTNTFDLGKSGSTLENDAISLTLGSITLGGDLVINASGDALASGDVFDLFDGTLSGTFSSIDRSSITLAGGLSWNDDFLYSHGVIYVTDGIFVYNPDGNIPIFPFMDDFETVEGLGQGGPLDSSKEWIYSANIWVSTNVGYQASNEVPYTAVFLRNANSHITKLVDISHAVASNGPQVELTFDGWVEKYTDTNEYGYVAYTTNSGAEWIEIMQLNTNDYTNYNTNNYNGPYTLTMDASTWAQEAKENFGIKFSQVANKNVEHFYIDNVVLDVVTNVVMTAYDTWGLAYGLGEGPDGDDDDDGLSNLYEFGLGGNPTNPADLGHVPTHGLTEQGGSNVLEYVYARQTDANSGLDYYLQLGSDLVFTNWANSGYTEVPENGDLGGGFEAVTNRVPTADSKKFIRLIIEQL